MPPEISRARLWSFTYFNFTPYILELINAIDCTWMIYQTELTKDGVVHLQGAIAFKTMKSFATAKSAFPCDARGAYSVHIEISYKSALANRIYCSKLDSRTTKDFVAFEKGSCYDIDTRLIPDRYGGAISLRSGAHRISLRPPLRIFLPPNRDIT